MTITRRSLLGLAAVLPFVAARAQAATTHDVKIKGFKFDPQAFDIKAGDTVRFTNDDSVPHTATANDQSWTTRTLSRGDSEEITFAEAGENAYFCKIHPSMKAVIRVN